MSMQTWKTLERGLIGEWPSGVVPFRNMPGVTQKSRFVLALLLTICASFSYAGPPIKWVAVDVTTNAIADRISMKDTNFCRKFEVRMVDSAGNNASHASALTVPLEGNLFWPSTTPDDCGPGTYDDTVELPANQSVLTFWARSTGTASGHNGTIKVATPTPNVFPDDANWRDGKIFHKWDANATSGSGSNPPPPPPPSGGGNSPFSDLKKICGVQSYDSGTVLVQPCDGWASQSGCSNNFLQWDIGSPGGQAMFGVATTAFMSDASVRIAYVTGQCAGAFDQLSILKLER